MRKAMVVMAWALAMAAAPGAHAQSTLEGRVDQIDKRLHTVERVVSRQTGGTTGMIQPEIAPAETPVDPTGTPATAPLADLQTRVAAVEGQVATLTGRVETAEHQLKQLQDSVDAYEHATDARLAALEGGGATASAPDGDGSPTPVKPNAAKPIGNGTASSRPAADPGRVQRLAGIARPKTGDGGEDAYTYGFRLWQAKLFPEAEAQLGGFAGKYPGHARISRAQNLLGMTYLDDNKPNLAAQIFYENYSKFPQGERAADSLLNLAKTLVVLKKPSTEVCRVYTEASKSYGGALTASQKATLDKGRADNKCR